MGSRWAVVILVTLISAVEATVGVAALAKPNCQSECGDVTIPYPFGIGDYCYITSDFFVHCNTTYGPPKPFIGNNEVLNISLEGNKLGYGLRS
ncbi:hypothetical protein PTKIN_Ptkin12aG0031700 [Pterospermum kingtungense]